MSKKKSKGEQDEQHIRALIRRQIRKDMRSMFATQNGIDKKKIISKYIQSHPGEDEFIKSVATDYAKAIQEMAAKGNANWGKAGGAAIQKQQQQPNTVGVKGPAKSEEPRPAIKVQVPGQSESDEDSQSSEDSNAQFIEQLMFDSQPQKPNTSNPPTPNPPNSKKQAKAEKAEARNAEAKKAKSEAKKAKAEAKKAKAQEQELKTEVKEVKVEPKKEKAEAKKAKAEEQELKTEVKEVKIEPKKAKAESNGEEEQPNLVNKTNALLETFKEDLASQRMASSPEPGASLSKEKTPDLEAQLQFLSLDEQNAIGINGSSSRTIEHAVLISPTLEEKGEKMPPQFGLLGHLATKQSEDLVDPRVMLNTNIPFSAFVCGLQGSGKSHTTSCIIENCSLPFQALGTLKKPLSTLVLHYNEYSSNVSSQPSEAAFLASIMPEYKKNYKKSIPVKVLTSPSNFHNLEKMYSQIPNVNVRPFLLQPQHLNIATMLSLMSMGKKDSMPLYMAQLTRILREMALINKGNFNYFEFRKRVRELRLDRSQTPFLEQRLDLLDSFLDLNGEGRNKGSDYFLDGGVTILDLSCPFMDQSTACILFRIAIDLFLHAHPSRGKMIVADEAHKYMNNTEAANALTETFMNIIRQQRHLGVRVIISTQEPTISPRLIDLCSITVVHRFSSPEWYQTIKKHISIDDKQATNGDNDNMDGLYHISSLRTGEALVFAPSSYLLDERQEMMDVKHKIFKMVIRKRITWDGGQTITSVR